MDNDSTTESGKEVAAVREKGHAPRPFIKWAGGKSQLLDALRQRLPESFGRYWEPFLGGGALFFSICPERAALSDINQELITTYQVVRDSVEALIEELGTHRYEKAHFYSVRDLDRDVGYADMPAVKRAARFIYLNRTCFNGLYRVNSKGHFNVPFGRYTNPRIADPENLRRCSQALQRVDIRLGSFRSIEERAQEGDVVYFDPPYVPLSETSSFTSYTKEGFGFEEQIALRDLCQRLANRGVYVLLSNSASPFVEALYEGFTIDRVAATRAINSKAALRGPIEELIITNYAKK